IAGIQSVKQIIATTFFFIFIFLKFEIIRNKDRMKDPKGNKKVMDIFTFPNIVYQSLYQKVKSLYRKSLNGHYFRM
ncbi:MAG: hypothetical protein PHV66_08590, partial [Bacteroidales bacterium]|nr:hypothetical protein [Bacteroidales bacterium]